MAVKGGRERVGRVTRKGERGEGTEGRKRVWG